MDQPQTFDTKPLLRPAQLEEARHDVKVLEAKLADKGTEDKATAASQLRRVSRSLAEQTPRPPSSAEEEARMVRRSEQLLGEIVPAMCSQEEMRKCPPGAVDKFLRGEGSPEMKTKIIEWKNLQLRLKPGEQEAANLERHRPTASTLNMDNAHIPGRQFFMPETSGPSVIFDDTEIALLRKHAPAIAFQLATLNNAQRAEVKQVLRAFQEEAEQTQAAA